jgi:thiamine biosynthesis lipoprotein ApbE
VPNVEFTQRTEIKYVPVDARTVTVVNHILDALRQTTGDITLNYITLRYIALL